LLQLIVPARNEQSRLPATLTELRAWALAARDSGGTPISVIVVDNASTDATASVAAAQSSPALPVQVVRCDVLGKGGAVRTGIMASTAPIVGYMDADGATHLDALRDGLELLASGADLVLGSRVVQGSRYHGRTNPVRIFGAHVYRRISTQIAPGILDTQCGFKLMSGGLGRRVLRDTRATGFSFDVEVIARFQRAGATVVEFPVEWTDVPGSTFDIRRHGVPAFAELVGVARTLRAHPAATPVIPLVPAAPEVPLATEAIEL
jgi:glycosyltransferase involved in cell wall biosynthesis